MKHILPALPYSNNALEPFMSQTTLEFHYGKHHQTYVNNLNALIVGTEFDNMSLEEIIKKSSGGIFNNAAQDFNHTFFWESMAPGKGGVPTGKIAAEINKKWGNFETFYEEFSKEAAALFGSGWTWLVVNGDGFLEILKTQNAGCPIHDGLKPLLVIDVWEHAYYLDKQNRRPAYIADFKNLINWDKVEERFLK